MIGSDWIWNTSVIVFSMGFYGNGAVLLGVLLEGPEVIHELYRRAIILPGSSAFSSAVYPTVQVAGGDTRKWLSFLGWFVLVIGLCGEGFFEGLVSTMGGKLQTFNEILLGDAQRQASEANLARAKIEEKLSARHLTAEQRSSLLREVKPLHITQLTVDTILGDLRLWNMLKSWVMHYRHVWEQWFDADQTLFRRNQYGAYL
jgi:hypothetical protein